MELSNAASDWSGGAASLRECLETLVQLLSPFAPHIAEELWREVGRKEGLTLLHWPDAAPALVGEEAYHIAVTGDRALRGVVQAGADADTVAGGEDFLTGVDVLGTEANRRAALRRLARALAVEAIERYEVSERFAP